MSKKKKRGKILEEGDVVAVYNNGIRSICVVVTGNYGEETEVIGVRRLNYHEPQPEFAVHTKQVRLLNHEFYFCI